ncbi:MAG: sel1 repeat family protein [Caldithrix sp.]|nr:MAG: sel1 repeat family protein [Caldithrix sp.]
MNKNKTIQISVFLSLFFGLTHLAQADYDRGVEAFGNKDYKTALTEFLQDANEGNAPSQNRLGEMYEKGKGVKKNREEAVRWYRLAAEQGYAPAQTNLAERYRKGKGVEKNKDEAERLYRLAAEQGYIEAQCDLAIFLFNRKGISSRSLQTGALVKDPGYKYKVKGNDNKQVEAYFWISVAAAENAKCGKWQKARILKENYKESLEVSTLFKAERLVQERLGNIEAVNLNNQADNGDAEAQFQLGMMYARGAGIERNKEEKTHWNRLGGQLGNIQNPFIGYHWLNLAAANGHEGAWDRKNRLCSRIIKKSRKDGELFGTNGLDGRALTYLLLDYYEAHPEAFSQTTVKTVLKTVCSE